VTWATCAASYVESPLLSAEEVVKPLRHRVAVVTGGSRGIGRAIALRLAKDGAHCVITYRRREEVAREVVRAIECLGAPGLALPLDLAEPSQVRWVYLTGQTIVLDGGLTILSPLTRLEESP